MLTSGHQDTLTIGQPLSFATSPLILPVRAVSALLVSEGWRGRDEKEKWCGAGKSAAAKKKPLKGC